MTEPRSLSQEEIELRQALVNAWGEVLKQYLPHGYTDLEGMDTKDALKSFFMMIGSVAGILIAGATDDPSNREWFSKAVSWNIPFGIESGDRFKRSAKSN